MLYGALFDIIKETAESVNEVGSFVHGRRLDITLAYPEQMPQIHLLPSITTTRTPTSNMDTTNVLMGFFQMGGLELTPDQSVELITAADIMARAFEDAILLVNGIDVSNFRIEPAYNLYAAIMTGVSVTFTMVSKRTTC